MLSEYLISIDSSGLCLKLIIYVYMYLQMKIKLIMLDYSIRSQRNVEDFCSCNSYYLMTAAGFLHLLLLTEVKLIDPVTEEDDLCSWNLIGLDLDLESSVKFLSVLGKCFQHQLSIFPLYLSHSKCTVKFCTVWSLLKGKHKWTCRGNVWHAHRESVNISKQVLQQLRYRSLKK